jgi:nicotinic acid phosphoribosyltransferase
MEQQIIQSLLDIDLYKLTMAQLAWLKHPHAYVQFGFILTKTGFFRAGFFFGTFT